MGTFFFRRFPSLRGGVCDITRFRFEGFLTGFFFGLVFLIGLRLADWDFLPRFD